MKTAFIYSEKYDISFWGIDKLHPFDGCKFSKAWNLFYTSSKEASAYLEPKAPVTDKKLERVHTKEYLESLNSSAMIAKIVEVWPLRFLPNSVLQKQLLTPMKYACAGTLLATETALAEKCFAMNFGGGFHHAFPDHGEGFCVYADVALAIDHAYENELLSGDDKILIIDLDAHRGNGVDAFISSNPNIKNFDIYNFQVYPGLHDDSRDDIPFVIPMKHGSDGKWYLSLLEKELKDFLEQHADAKLVFYNAGTDILDTDRLGGLKVSFEDVIERDKFVLAQLNNLGIPTVTVTSGGYTDTSHKLIAEMAKTITTFS